MISVVKVYGFMATQASCAFTNTFILNCS